jgi:AraC-like DNA-binding protein
MEPSGSPVFLERPPWLLRGICTEMTRKPISSQTSCAAFWVKGIAEALELEGLDLAALFAEASLDLAVLKDPDARFASDDVSRLWRLAVARSGNPTLGLARSQIASPANFDVVAYTMMSAPNLLDVFERLVRYVSVVNDGARITADDDPEGVRLVLRISVGQQSVPWQRYVFDLMTFLSFCRWVSIRDLRPIALELAFPPTADIEPYGNKFKCPLRFNAPANALLWSRSDVSLPLPTAHRLLDEVHQRIAEEYLQRVNSSPTRQRVRAILVRCLSDGEPTRAKVAEAMATSERTLHRRLGAEGTSFREVLDDTRCELAEQYLSRSDLSLADTTYLLGFQDQSSFFRAFRRWFGTSPKRRGSPNPTRNGT